MNMYVRIWMLNIYVYVYIRAVSANIQSWGVGFYQTHLCLSFHACEVILQKWICHLTHTRGSCRNMWIVHVTHMTEFISHICVRHATHINKYATHLNEIRRTYESTSHVTYMKRHGTRHVSDSSTKCSAACPDIKSWWNLAAFLAHGMITTSALMTVLFIPLSPPPFFSNPVLRFCIRVF